MRHHRHEHGCGHGALGPAVVLAMAGGRGGPHHNPWGWGGPRGGFGPPHRRPRSRRGDVRAAILLLLEEEPRNGYGLMQEVERRSDGEWRPSPGSVYPALAQLEDEGLIAPADAEQGKAYALTDAGRAYVEERRDRLGVPWEDKAADTPVGLQDLKTAVGQLAMAAMQVAQAGDPDAIAAARRTIDDARKALYRLLAGDEED